MTSISTSSGRKSQIEILIKINVTYFVASPFPTRKAPAARLFLLQDFALLQRVPWSLGPHVGPVLRSGVTQNRCLTGRSVTADLCPRVVTRTWHPDLGF